MLKQHKAFDSEGIFLGDASSLVVPDHEKYEGSVRRLCDEQNHPGGKESEKERTVAQRARCPGTRWYKLVSRIHTNRRGDFFRYAAVVVVSGKAHECPVL